jgi:PAS domain S-box-containing protein
VIEPGLATHDDPGDDPGLHRSFRRALLTTVAFPLLALAALAGGLLWQLDDLLGDFERVEHSDRVITAANSTLRNLIDVETGVRGYLLTGTREFLEPYTAALSRVRSSFDELRSLVADNPAQLRDLDEWNRLTTAWIAFAESQVQQRPDDVGESVRHAAEGKRRMDEIRGAFGDFVTREESLRSERSDHAQKTAAAVLSAGLVFTLFVGAACAVFFGRQLFRVSRTFRDALGSEHAARAAAEISERRYSSLVAATTSIVWTMGADGGFGEPQPSWERHTGQTWTEHAGRGWLQACHPDDRAEVRASLEHALADRSPFLAEARLWHAASRAYRWVVAHAVPVARPDGDVREWIGTISDIDDRRRVELERDDLLHREQMARGAAEDANRAKDQFLAMVSHELRNPLSPILAWSHLMQTSQLGPDKQRQGLEAIERAARSQGQLIEDLLDVSRIVSGKLRLDVRPIELGPVVEAAVETVRPSADARHVRLVVVLDPRCGPIAGDPERLQQVIWNLLSNAVKFTPKGGRVDVQLTRVNSHVELAVSDSGEGIPPDMLPHVFERFWQAEEGTTRRRGGLGLGLAIAHHLAELHGGSISAHSNGVGRGAAFRVSLPLMVVAGDAYDPRRRHPTRGHGAGSAPLADLDGVRVLVVDDEPDTTAVVQTLLATYGAEVRTAGSAKDALAIFDEWTPDILLSDIGMPHEDGYALIARLRARQNAAGGTVPAVALTAYARVEDRINVLAAGFDMHVAKPIDPAELVAVVSRLAADGRRRAR